ncbi:Uncharacterized membrane protein [Bryocella elongata]|uniref:Uncharacterized membrane protein n=1 Tax=Bryocella elongata TaxID=863522 RepID=A0A1H5S5I5_9BACT|nr:TMEM175 family protein [Bryocella elongata]SEF45876.1 Uncharacterized membrane protein [Bryocella elongata]
MEDKLTPSRMEAFSDGVIAVIITIMVLEIHVPTRDISNLDGLRHIAPILVVYLLSFIQVGIYWVNHHYLVDDLQQITHGILWSNLALLFCLSLIPAATAWMGERGLTPFSIALYAAVCIVPAIPWFVLSMLICAHSGIAPANSLLKTALSASSYLCAILGAHFSTWISLGFIALVAVIWLIPPKRVVEQTRAQSRWRQDHDPLPRD